MTLPQSQPSPAPGDAGPGSPPGRHLSMPGVIEDVMGVLAGLPPPLQVADGSCLAWEPVVTAFL